MARLWDFNLSASISVVIPVLNGAEFIADAIASVLKQTLSAFELIVIDDGSTDQTAAIVKTFDDRRLQYVYQANAGLSAARNAGIRVASAPWIAFLDADDRWLPGKLAAQIDRARSCPDAHMVYCGATWLSRDGEVLADIPAVVEGDVLLHLLLGNCIAGSASSTMLHRGVLDKVGSFDEKLRCCEDWDLWLRVASVTRIVKVEDKLVQIINRPGSLAKDARRMRDAGINVLQKAFSSYAIDFKRVRSRALAATYMYAAMTLHEQRQFGAAARDVARSILHRPTYLPAYWRLVRALLHEA
jgi:glycosyltransferase involved in cell wall biosynthesis